MLYPRAAVPGILRALSTKMAWELADDAMNWISTVFSTMALAEAPEVAALEPALRSPSALELGRALLVRSVLPGACISDRQVKGWTRAFTRVDLGPSTDHVRNGKRRGGGGHSNYRFVPCWGGALGSGVERPCPPREDSLCSRICDGEGGSGGDAHGDS